MTADPIQFVLVGRRYSYRADSRDASRSSGIGMRRANSIAGFIAVPRYSGIGRS
jgi:hypothetical protein